MSYEKTIWKNRIVEKPRTVTQQDNGDGTITLIPAEGNVIEVGTPIIAETMNNIENGIEEALGARDALESHLADYVRQPAYGTATVANAKVITLDPVPTEYIDGMAISFKNATANTGAVTLNVNSLGAKSVLKSNGSALTSGNLKVNSIYTVRYNGTNFILQGEGGSGNALASDLLSGKTASTDAGDITGTMVNQGIINQTITTQNGVFNIPTGYVASGSKVTATFPNLIAENIKQGVNVGGVVGTLPLGKSFKVFNGFTVAPWDHTMNKTIILSGLTFIPKYLIMRIPYLEQNFGAYLHDTMGIQLLHSKTTYLDLISAAFKTTSVEITFRNNYGNIGETYAYEVTVFGV